ncbi:MAG: hypothetical protein FJ104_17000, partial [Deltaproteobacteria bacterium]|nr:hypothetical protein [Deltaproteobacteria bacterium]
GVVVVHVAGIALQAKFFQYHYGATLPLLSLVAGLGLAKLARLAGSRGTVALVGLGAVVTALAASRVALRHNPGTFWERSAARLAYVLFRQGTREELDARLYHVVDYDLDVDRRAAREIARLTAPGESIHVWGFEPVIYWFSGRRPASRFVYDVPQRARWERERARRELLGDLLASPPRVLAVQHGDVFSFVTGDSLDSAGELEGFPELAALLAGEYELASVVEDLDLYLRVAPDPPR